MKRKFFSALFVLVLTFSLIGLVAPASSPLVTEVKAAPDESTVEIGSEEIDGVDVPTFDFTEGLLEDSMVIMRWTEQNTTETEKTGLLTSILIKESTVVLEEDDITLRWSYNPYGGWNTIVESWDADDPPAIARGYDAEWVIGEEGGFSLPASMDAPDVLWIMAIVDSVDDLAAITGEVIIFSDEEGGTDRRYDDGEEESGIETTLEVMYTAELLGSAPMFYADDDGTTTDPIQDAVEDADPGDTVIVHPGTYTGNTVSIDKSLTLESASGDWSDTTIGQPTSPVILIEGVGMPPFTGHVTISGFTITYGDPGIKIDGLAHGATVTVTNCFIYRNCTGIRGRGDLDGGIFIDESIITENGCSSGEGIKLDEVMGTVEITNSVIGGWYDLLLVEALLVEAWEADTAYTFGQFVAPTTSNGDLYIYKCTVAGTSDDTTEPTWPTTIGDTVGDDGVTWTCHAQIAYEGNAGDGIQINEITETGNVLIDNCKIADNNNGIKVKEGKTVNGVLDITDNIIGAYAYDLSEEDSWFSGNYDGIHIASVGSTGDVTIAGNWIGDNDNKGIDFGGSYNVEGTVLIDDNRIGAWTQADGENEDLTHGGNGNKGIFVYKLKDNGSLTITNNQIADNGGSCTGIHIYETQGDTTIAGNDVGSWTQEEFTTFEKTNGEYEEVTYYLDEPVTHDGNEGKGIKVEWVPRGTLTIGGPEIGDGNTVSDNTGNGIQVMDNHGGKGEVTIQGNTVDSNGSQGSHGIELNDVQYATVDDNEITDHANGAGIFVKDSHCNAIINNVITGNVFGVYIDWRSRSNGIVGNWIHDNIQDGIMVFGKYTDILMNDISGNTGAIARPPVGCGIVIEDPAKDTVIYYNNITLNTDLDAGSYGVYAYKHKDRVVDARWNWWGNASGPYHGGTNPGGTGDAVSSYVDYSDWTTSGGYDYELYNMPWDNEGPDILSAVVTPDVRSLYSALSDMWFSSWTTDSPFSTGPSEGRYYVTTSDVGTGLPHRGVRYVDIDIRAFVEQLLGETSLEDLGLPPWFIETVDSHGQLRLCEDDFCGDSSIWTTSGPLPFTLSMLVLYMGEEEFFAMVRPGDIQVPVTAYDWCGNQNPTETNIQAAIVDEALALGRGWNLRSTPIDLAYNSWADIAGLGDELEYLGCYRWNADLETWEQLTDDGLRRYGELVSDTAIVRPLDGLAIKCENPDSLGLVYNRDDQPAVPSLPVYEGWNLIGLAVSPPHDPYMPVNDALISIEEVLADGVRGYIIVDSPRQYVEEPVEYGSGECSSIWYDWYFGQQSWLFLRHGLEPVPPIPDMTIGGAYWVFMERDDMLAGFSSTPFLSLTIEQHEDLDCVPRYPATTMMSSRDWLSVMSCPCWECWVPEGWQGLQWVEIDYKGQFTLDGFYSFYEEQMPEVCGWQFSHKLVIDARGDEREGRLVFWKHLPYDPQDPEGEPPYTFIAHFSVYTNEQGPDFIEVQYLPIDVPTYPGVNLAAWYSFPQDDGPLHMEFEGSGTIEGASEFYVGAMAKLGWKLDVDNSGWENGECLEWGWWSCKVWDSYYVLRFHKPSVGDGIPPTRLYCEITIENMEFFGPDMIEVEVVRGTGQYPD